MTPKKPKKRKAREWYAIALASGILAAFYPEHCDEGTVKNELAYELRHNPLMYMGARVIKVREVVE